MLRGWRGLPLIMPSSVMNPETATFSAPMTTFAILLKNLGDIFRFLKYPLRQGALVSRMALGLAMVAGDIRVAGRSGVIFPRARTGSLSMCEACLLDSR